MNLTNMPSYETHLLSMVLVYPNTLVVATWEDPEGWTRTIRGTIEYVSPKVQRVLDGDSSIHGESPFGQLTVGASSGTVTRTRVRPSTISLEVDEVLVTDDQRWDKLDEVRKAGKERFILLKAGGHSYSARWVVEDDHPGL